MSFFDKINNYLIVNAIKEILRGGRGCSSEGGASVAPNNVSHV